MGQAGDPSTGVSSCSHQNATGQYKPYLQDGATISTSPHKVYVPQNNDPALHQRTKMPGALPNHR